eukprot:scaffold249325_cov30-Tisochrysis_lutea.AAC.14
MDELLGLIEFVVEDDPFKVEWHPVKVGDHSICQCMKWLLRLDICDIELHLLNLKGLDIPVHLFVGCAATVAGLFLTRLGFDRQLSAWRRERRVVAVRRGPCQICVLRIAMRHFLRGVAKVQLRAVRGGLTIAPGRAGQGATRSPRLRRSASGSGVHRHRSVSAQELAEVEHIPDKALLDQKVKLKDAQEDLFELQAGVVSHIALYAQLQAGIAALFTRIDFVADNVALPSDVRRTNENGGQLSTLGLIVKSNVVNGQAKLVCLGRQTRQNTKAREAHVGELFYA